MVRDKVVCERLSVTKMYKVVCERVVCERVVCDKVVCDKVVCDKDVCERDRERCERLCVTKLRVTKWYLREMDSLAAWMSPSATPASPNEGRCRQVPRLPGKTKVDVTKCHACHAKCGWMSPSARPATQSAARPSTVA